LDRLLAFDAYSSDGFYTTITSKENLTKKEGRLVGCNLLVESYENKYMAKKEVKKVENTGGAAGLGLAIVAATAAAGYFLYGSKNGAKNRAKIKGWSLKAKGEVLEHMEKLKDVSEDEYNKVLDKVGDKYAKVKNIDTDEVKAMIDDMRKHWKNIQKHIEPKAKKVAKKTVKKATKAAKTVVNKTAKKVVKATAEKKTPEKKV